MSGNHLVDGRGHPVRLLGVNRSSFEYACAQGWAIVDGPISKQAIAAMKRWRINAVRIPLNEACWLGLRTVKRAFRGDRYRAVVTSYVRRLNRAGLYVILDLHWNAPGKQKALGQQVMADADHSPDFWRSVATRFRGDHAVLFDLYNEPHDLSWGCWLRGCAPWTGMQQLVNAVRSTGARQPIMVGGPFWAGQLEGWLAVEAEGPAQRPRRLCAQVQLRRLPGAGVLGQADRAGRGAAAPSSPASSARTTARTASSTTTCAGPTPTGSPTSAGPGTRGTARPGPR